MENTTILKIITHPHTLLYYNSHTRDINGIQAPTSVIVICTRRGLEKSIEGVLS